MASGFNFLTNAIDKTPVTKDSWTDVDVSGDGVPDGSTGVILEVRHNGSNYPVNAGFRKNGSTDDYVLQVGIADTAYPQVNGVFVGLDGNRVFEAKVGTNVEVWLIGYTDSTQTLETNIVDVTPGSTGWQDIDLSSYIPVDATGVIMMIRWVNATGNPFEGGVRRNGSSDTNSLCGIQILSSIPYPYVFEIAKPDSNRIIEGNVSNTTYVKIYYCGYTKSPVVIKDDPVDVSIGTASAWTDVDVTTQTSANADGAIIFTRVPAWSPYDGNIRKNGSTDDRTTNAGLGKYDDNSVPVVTCRGIGLDAGQIFEGWIENTAVDFYVIGYCEPTGVTVQSVSDSLAIADSVLTDKTIQIADSLAIADALSTDKTIIITDALGIADTLLTDKTIQVTDNLAIVDAVLGHKTVIISDSLIISEEVNVEVIGAIVKTVTDALSIADSVITDKTIQVEDVLSTLDAVAIDKHVIISDSLTLADAIIVIGGEKYLKIRIHSDELGKLGVTHDPIVLLKLKSQDNIGRIAGEDV